MAWILVTVKEPLDEIKLPRLRLVPIDRRTAEAVVVGDLASVEAAEGWPQEGTLNGLRMAIEHGHPPGWMVTLDGKVIGGCGIHGRPDESGVVEIGYGLAAPFRGRGYGTELVAAITGWLLEQPDVGTVLASTLADNLASRRVLEKNGFRLAGYDSEGRALYRHDR